MVQNLTSYVAANASSIQSNMTSNLDYQALAVMTAIVILIILAAFLVSQKLESTVLRRKLNIDDNSRDSAMPNASAIKEDFRLIFLYFIMLFFLMGSQYIIIKFFPRPKHS